jgi:hypothetical protein
VVDHARRRGEARAISRVESEPAFFFAIWLCATVLNSAREPTLDGQIPLPIMLRNTPMKMRLRMILKSWFKYVSLDMCSTSLTRHAFFLEWWFVNRSIESAYEYSYLFF